jgi:hypothetical protein
MKLVALSAESARSLVQELRAMADLPPGANSGALRRAKEIRFLLQGQSFTTPTSAAKADEVYRQLEVLFHPTRWREKPSLEGFRKQMKSSCARLQAHLGL